MNTFLVISHFLCWVEGISFIKTKKDLWRITCKSNNLVIFFVYCRWCIGSSLASWLDQSCTSPLYSSPLFVLHFSMWLTDYVEMLQLGTTLCLSGFSVAILRPIWWPCLLTGFKVPTSINSITIMVSRRNRSPSCMCLGLPPLSSWEPGHLLLPTSLAERSCVCHSQFCTLFPVYWSYQQVMVSS